MKILQNYLNRPGKERTKVLIHFLIGIKLSFQVKKYIIIGFFNNIPMKTSGPVKLKSSIFSNGKIPQTPP